MTQSKKMSFTESLFNVTVGYLVAFLSQLLIFPFFGIHIPIHDNLLIGLWFTLISIVRSYFLRRLFNWLSFTETIAPFIKKEDNIFKIMDKVK